MRPNSAFRVCGARQLMGAGFVLLVLLSARGLSAQPARQPQWSDPKIPARFARELEARGQLGFVEQRFDLIAYFPWPGFSTDDGGSTTALGYVLEDGQRIAYIAVQDHSDGAVADALVQLAQQMPSWFSAKIAHAPPDVIFPFIALVVVAIVGITAGICNRDRTADRKRTVQPASAEVMGFARTAASVWAANPKQDRPPAAWDIGHMLADIERIDQATWPTRGRAKRSIFRNIHDRTEVVEAYLRFFSAANDALEARLRAEKAKSELMDSEFLRQKQLHVKLIELEAKESRATEEREHYDL